MGIVHRSFLMSGVIFLLLVFSHTEAFGQVIPPSTYLFVEVNDTKGKPISDARLTLYSKNRAEEFAFTTDKAGRIQTSFQEFQDPFQTRFLVQFSAPGYVALDEVMFVYQPLRYSVSHNRTTAVGEVFTGLKDFTDPHSNAPPDKITLSKIPREPPDIHAIGNSEQKHQLIVACKMGDVLAVRRLFAVGIRPDTTDQNGVPAIAWAALSGSSETILALIEAGATVKDKTSPGGASLLYYLAEGLPRNYERGQVRPSPGENDDVVLQLLKAGANVNAKDIYRSSVLNSATKYSAPDTIRTLVRIGAKISEADNNGQTALMSAIDAGIFQNVNSLLDLGAAASINARDNRGETALLHSVMSLRATNAEILKLLISAKPDVNVFDNEGKSALMFAASYASPEVIELLIRSGAKINARDKNGETPLMYSSNSPKGIATKLLLEAGAFVDARDTRGSTALMHAAPQYHNDSNPEVVRTLLAAHANVNVINREGDTALILAAHWYAESTIELLLASDAKASPNVKDAKGWTPLMHVARSRWAYHGIEALLAAGANVNEANHDGQTALMLASEWGSLEMVNMLLKGGAATSINAKDKDGRTALMYVERQYSGDESAEKTKALIAAGAKVYEETRKRPQPR